MLIVLFTFPGIVHSSVAVKADDPASSPPAAKAAVVELPDPCIAPLAVLRSATSVQLLPLHCSVAPVTDGVNPPNAMASVLLTPVPPTKYLAVFKLLVSVQLVPFQISVSFLTVINQIQNQNCQYF